MAERPILFSGPMVRALLDGSKTQTRRVVKPQFAPDAEPAEMGATNERGHQISGHSGLWWDDTTGDADASIRCPFGQPGDRLWVREAWRVTRRHDKNPPRDIRPRECTVFFEAGGSIANQDGGEWERDDWPKRPGPLPEWVGKRRPGMFMPRWASRITLEITGVFVERLQTISRGDAMAEGCPFPNMANGDNPCQWYAGLWARINGVDSWDANPWVWVVEFERVSVPPTASLGRETR